MSFLLYLNHFMILGISLLELNATENSFKTSRLHMHSVTDTTCDSFIFSFLFHFSTHITSSCHLMPFLIGPNGFSFLFFVSRAILPLLWEARSAGSLILQNSLQTVTPGSWRINTSAPLPLVKNNWTTQVYLCHYSEAHVLHKLDFGVSPEGITSA